MYNTTEVIVLEIKKAEIQYFKKGSLFSTTNENIKHVKVLPYLSIVQSVEGSYDIALGSGSQKQTGERGFFIAPAGVQQTIVHHVNKQSGKMICRWVFLDVVINKAFRLESLYQFPVVIKDDRKEELNALFDSLFATNDIWDNYSDCYKLLGLLLEMATPVRQEPHQGVQAAVGFMAEHYAEPITIGALANVANMSESNFYAAFKKCMGDSPIAYLNHYRLSVAAEKLTQTVQTVSEISYSVGIRDPLYFSKLFKKTYGMTPKEYRLVYQTVQIRTLSSV